MSEEISPTPAERSNDERFEHTPVMVERIVELFDPVPAGTYVDATLGGAGHAYEICAARPDLVLLGIDQDTSAIAAAKRRLASVTNDVTIVEARFDELSAVVAASNGDPVTAILFDLGVSSPQLDRPDRGFSYQHDGPLDMRMDQAASLTAADVVNDYDPPELRRIISRYGDERFADRVARAIVKARPINSTVELAEVVKAAIPAATRRSGGHPAKRTFQALRMEVNAELSTLSVALRGAIDSLAPGGRCAVLSYHSGEDRIVKAAFKEAQDGGCECPIALGCVCGATPTVSMVTKGAETPTESEIAKNRRARPAKLRCVERLVTPTRQEQAA